MNILKRFITPGIISILLFAILFAIRFGEEHYVADTFFVTGIMMVLFCGLIFVANEGVFDLIVFGTKKFVDLFRKVKQTTESFPEYVASKSTEQKTSLWPSLIVSSIYLIVGIILSLI